MCHSRLRCTRPHGPSSLQRRDGARRFPSALRCTGSASRDGGKASKLGRGCSVVHWLVVWVVGCLVFGCLGGCFGWLVVESGFMREMARKCGTAGTREIHDFLTEVRNIAPSDKQVHTNLMFTKNVGYPKMGGLHLDITIGGG